jgi:folate-binding protein YgfZ
MTPPTGAPGAVDPGQYDALRLGCGAYRLERDVLSVAGPDAAGYLQGQCSQDLAALEVGAAVPSLVLEPDGKLCALVDVARTGPEEYVLAVQGGFGETVAARLARFRLRSKVTIEPLDWQCVALRGATVAAPAPVAGAGLVILPFSFGGWTGVDLLGSEPDAAVPAEAVWCDTPAWEACRVEAGVPVMGRELDGRTIAAEAHLVESAVSLTKGCYTGQELIARLDARGNKVPRRLCGLVPLDAAIDTAQLDGVVLRHEDKEAGEVTSVAHSPALGTTVALGYVRRAVETGETVEATSGSGDPIAVAVRPLPLVSESPAQAPVPPRTTH